MNLIEQIKVNDVSIDGYQGTYYSENPEWVKVITDSDEKVLAGIKADGTVEWSAGVPTPIKDFIKQRLEEQLDLKVDKEEGKSLIDSSVADSQSSSENPEFLTVTTDSEDKVLHGIKSDGTTLIGGDAIINGNVSIPSTEIESTDNPEYIKVTTDADGKVLDGIKKDGSHYIHNIQSECIDAKVDKEAGKSLIDSYFADSQYSSENPEFLAVTTDSENKILESISLNGIKNINIPINNGAAIIKTTSNQEFIEVKLDAEGKIISCIKNDGTKIENVGLETNRLVLSESGLTEFERDLKNHGFTGGQGDWSDEKELHIPEPKCAIVNFSGISNMPQAKFVDM